MLIRNADVWQRGLADVRIEGGRIAAIAPPGMLGDSPAIDAAGGALLPGLHDHHLHLAGLAVRAASVPCGPPEVTGRDDLARALRAKRGSGWIRGIGYHESVMGLPSASELDALVPDRPLRIQHRSGRMWLLNSCALDDLLSRASPPAGMERASGKPTGRLFDEDRWLAETLAARPPDLGAVSQQLAAFGITGVTDMSPRNDPAFAGHITAQRHSGSLLQHCWLAGTLPLANAIADGWHPGPVKLHLHEAALPDYEDTLALIVQAHRQKRGVAVHCVSETELVFAIAAFEEAGALPGDRIEHASVASPDLVARIAALGLHVCVQPHFIHERGDRYLIDVEPRHIPDLYRLASLLSAGIPLSGGSDAPFGNPDPWLAMRAAVNRQTAAGSLIGGSEALGPEQALALYLADPADLSCQRRISPGEPADLCLLAHPWAQARERLLSADVRATFIAGRIVHDGIHQPPIDGMTDA